MKFFPVSAALVAAAVALVVTVSPALPISTPPTTRGVASGAVWDALLAIARARATDAGAADRAMPAYEAAVQQFNAGDFTGAQASAQNVLRETAVAPLPQPSLYPPAIPQQQFYAIANPANLRAADATAMLAVARQAMSQCGAPSATPAPAIAQQFATGVNALVALDYHGTQIASNAVITACANATTAFAAQQAALPQPSSTPIPMESYSPLPVATLIPDPALQPKK